MIFVNLVCDAALERDGGKLRSTWQRHLDWQGAFDFQERQFVACQWLHLTELGGNDPSHATHGGEGGLSCLPASPNRVPQVEALDGVCEIAHEISPPELAIRGSVKSELFLFGKNAQDLLILYLPQQFWTRAAPCFEQLRRTEKTADVICSGESGHTFTLLLMPGGYHYPLQFTRNHPSWPRELALVKSHPQTKPVPVHISPVGAFRRCVMPEANRLPAP